MSGSRVVREKRKSLVIEVVNPDAKEEEEEGMSSKMEPLVLDLGEGECMRACICVCGCGCTRSLFQSFLCL